ncbi:hypothetical protein B23_1189 [Geobacillus thermoleovorans B23]|nr:hypothetical protein B23_1189 [Geobacillus thermoleovorans B23]
MMDNAADGGFPLSNAAQPASKKAPFIPKGRKELLSRYHLFS